jgi:hypothetical protein
MNEWLTDPRAVRGEELGYEAECAERDGDFARARDRYRAAATEYAGVALSVSPDHPNTRSALAIAAVACFARAHDFGRAVDLAERMLAQPGALFERGRTELLRMVRTYALLVEPARLPAKRAARSPHRMRDAVRGRRAAPKDAA